MTRCSRWRGQARVLWKRIGKLCEWKEPRAQEVRLLFDDVRSAKAVLSFLRDTRIGRIVPQALRRRWEGEKDREKDREGEEGGLDPRKKAYFPFVLLLSILFLGETTFPARGS